MDADAALLERVANGGVANGEELAYVRIYKWSAPTVTLGHFQSLDDAPPPGLESCPRVRRLTGGGAILHDREVTYSCVIPATHPLRKDPLQLYVVVHEAIIKLLLECGVSANLRGESESGEAEPWLCFLRKDPRDIVVGHDKVVGSAQRRRQGNILQHGSVLLAASSLTPSIPGLADLEQGFDSDRFEAHLGGAIVAAICR